jgi:hypothetical protein
LTEQNIVIDLSKRFIHLNLQLVVTGGRTAMHYSIDIDGFQISAEDLYTFQVSLTLCNRYNVHHVIFIKCNSDTWNILCLDNISVTELKYQKQEMQLLLHLMDLKT